MGDIFCVSCWWRCTPTPLCRDCRGIRVSMMIALFLEIHYLITMVDVMFLGTTAPAEPEWLWGTLKYGIASTQ